MDKDLQTLNEQNKLVLWVGRISEYRSRGQNVKIWCRKNGICEQMATAIIRMEHAQQEVQFAEVMPAQPVCCGNVAVTVCIAGTEADIRSGADVATMETLLRVSKSC